MLSEEAGAGRHLGCFCLFRWGQRGLRSRRTAGRRRRRRRRRWRGSGAGQRCCARVRRGRGARRGLLLLLRFAQLLAFNKKIGDQLGAVTVLTFHQASRELSLCAAEHISTRNLKTSSRRLLRGLRVMTHVLENQDTFFCAALVGPISKQKFVQC